ncbi:MAG: sigma-70 family RNA polymerase sigma factor [Planctomycetota bacterium]|nr:MAG: sigma-70 family RNA polymerase sigma factor [Planctomycetota bacterium]
MKDIHTAQVTPDQASREASMHREAVLAEREWLARLVRGLVRNPWDAEDVCQETLLAALQTRLANRGALRAWLRQTARHGAALLARSGERRARNEQRAAAAAETGSAESGVEREEIEKLLVTALEDMPAQQRRPLLVRFYEDRPLAHVAAMLGVSETAAHMRVQRALNELGGSLDRRLGAGWRQKCMVAFAVPLGRQPRSAPAWLVHVAAACTLVVAGGAAWLAWPSPPGETASSGPDASLAPPAQAAAVAEAPGLRSGRAGAGAPEPDPRPAAPAFGFRGVVTDELGAPLAGARVVARSKGVVASARTAADGAYALPWADPATWLWSGTLVVYAPEWTSPVVRGATPGTPAADVSIRVRRGLPVWIHAVDQDSGQPRAGTALCLRNGSWFAWGETDERGRVLLHAPEPGTYAVACVSRPGFASSDLVELEVRSDRGHAPVVVGLGAPVGIPLAAVDAQTLERLPQAQFSLQREAADAGACLALTPAGGATILAGVLPDHSVLVRATCPDYEQVEIEVSGYWSGPATVPLERQRRIALQLHAAGLPLQAQTVQWSYTPGRLTFPGTGDEDQPLAHSALAGEGVTDARGWVELPIPGRRSGRSVELSLRPRDGNAVPLGCYALGGLEQRPTELDLAPRSRPVPIEVRDLQDRPLPGVTVSAGFSPNARSSGARRVLVGGSGALLPGEQRSFGACARSDAAGRLRLEVPDDMDAAWSALLDGRAFIPVAASLASCATSQREGGTLCLRLPAGASLVEGRLVADARWTSWSQMEVLLSPILPPPAPGELQMTYLCQLRPAPDGRFAAAGLAACPHRLLIRAGGLEIFQGEITVSAGPSAPETRVDLAAALAD